MEFKCIENETTKKRGAKANVSITEFTYGILKTLIFDEGSKSICAINEENFVEECKNGTTEEPVHIHKEITLYATKDGQPYPTFKEKQLSTYNIRLNCYSAAYQSTALIHTYLGVLDGDTSDFMRENEPTDEELDELESEPMEFLICEGSS